MPTYKCWVQRLNNKQQIMDIIDLRSIATVAALVTFVGIWVWAWSGRHKKDFDEAARLPLEGDEE